MIHPRTSRSRRPIAIAIAAATVAVLTACSTATSTTSKSSTPEATSSAAAKTDWVTPRTMPAGKGSGKADGVFPRTVRHFEGSTALDAKPKRVVVVSSGQADAALTLGVVPVGSTSGDGADLVPSYLTTAFPKKTKQLANVTDVGSRFAPNVESIAALKPDLILMNTAGKDAATLYKNLTKLAPTVATQGTGLYWKQDFLLVGDALGLRQKASNWLSSYQDDAAEWGETVKGSPTVSFLRHNADRTRVFGVASFSGSVAEDAGLGRPESQSFTDDTSHDISAEELSQADADWILYGVQGGDRSEVTSMDLWPTLDAVTKKHAVLVDDDVFYLNVGPTAARGILTKLEKTIPTTK